MKKNSLRIACGYSVSTFAGGPVSDGAHVPHLNFTVSYVAISEHSHVTCRSYIKAGVHVKAVLMSLNTAFPPISRSRFKQR